MISNKHRILYHHNAHNEQDNIRLSSALRMSGTAFYLLSVENSTVRYDGNEEIKVGLRKAPTAPFCSNNH